MKGKRKRGKETSMCGCLSHTPCLEPSLQPRHVPWLGVEQMTLWFAGWHSVHWATPVRAEITQCFMSIISQWNWKKENFKTKHRQEEITRTISNKNLYPEYMKIFIRWKIIVNSMPNIWIDTISKNIYLDSKFVHIKMPKTSLTRKINIKTTVK